MDILVKSFSNGMFEFEFEYLTVCFWIKKEGALSKVKYYIVGEEPKEVFMFENNTTEDIVKNIVTDLFPLNITIKSI